MAKAGQQFLTFLFRRLLYFTSHKLAEVDDILRVDGYIAFDTMIMIAGTIFSRESQHDDFSVHIFPFRYLARLRDATYAFLEIMMFSSTMMPLFLGGCL